MTSPQFVVTGCDSPELTQPQVFDFELECWCLEVLCAGGVDIKTKSK